MTSIRNLKGKCRLSESHGSAEYRKEVGVGLALRKMGAMAKLDCIITCAGNNIAMKTESTRTLKRTRFSSALGEKSGETTADGREPETVCTFGDGALVVGWHHRKTVGKLKMD
ncbi:fatty acid-binding protein 5-like [Acomys russatus]|uniref:fatty acid-binding protein 5-like n=1 Tax=Acomys russatus TaxID=60746 RepID=UPI0021E200C4|nr:fatty acid-binding protein 5-like [Acomys russatus]